MDEIRKTLARDTVLAFCTKFHQNIYGACNDVQTDHCPVESILRKRIAKASPRRQRMILQLQRYTLNVRYVPGRLMYVADTLSRAFIRGEPSCGAPDDMEVHVHNLVENLPATAEKLEEFRQVIGDDPLMKCLRRFIHNGWPKLKSAVPPEIQSYWGICDELHEADRLMLFGDRLIVSTMLQLIHEGHLGGYKCKSRARSSLYWPCMCHDIEETVAKCSICLKYRAAQQIRKRWEKVAVDIMNYQGHDYIVVVDFYSKYPERAVRTMKNILKKANAEGRDPYLSLLAYRNTADAGMSYLPAQMLTSRSLNTKVPTLPSLLQPKVVDARPQPEQRHQQHKSVLDRGARELTELHPGDVVRVRHNNV